MNTIKAIYTTAFTLSAASLVACGPAPDSSEITLNADVEKQAKVIDNTLPKLGKKKARLLITLSCRKGNLPGQSVSVMPIRAEVMLADNAYTEWLTQKSVDAIKKNIEAGEDVARYNFEVSVQGEEDGIVDFELLAQRPVRVAIIPNDPRFTLMPSTLSNHEWARPLIQNGKTAKFNLIMTQAWCDKNHGIRRIEPDSYNIQVQGFSADYKSMKSAGFGVDKRFYFRENTGNETFLKGSLSNQVHLSENISHMKINNVQSIWRIKRVCGNSADSLDMTVKADAALGVKSYDGSIGGNAVQCTEAWNTSYPFTYTRHGNEDYPASELYLRAVDSHNTRQRSTCDYKELAKINSPGPSYPEGCLESSVRHINVFEDAPGSGVFPWGKLHKYSWRIDLTKPEVVKGKVPPTILD